jgi:hypothetical protein
MLLVLFLLFVDTHAAVQPQPRPTSEDIRAARGLWTQLKRAQSRAGVTRVQFDDRTVSGLSPLLSDASGIQRLDARLEDGVLTGSASVPLPLGLWLNGNASVTGQHEGFPAFRLQVGRITFPGFVSRWFADLGRWGLQSTGTKIPPLGDLVRQVSVDRRRGFAEVALPRTTGVFDQVMSVGAGGLNQEIVAEVYCRVALEQAANPTDELHTLVNRAFAGAPTADAQEYSRAAFVALSLLVVGERAEPLAPNSGAFIPSCRRPTPALQLHAREDLAKHWALSAALAASLGERVSAKLGEWKELDDSLAGGSGFSFVDLAADRAGTRAAALALTPATADSSARALKTADEADLLPLSLLAAPEGLGEHSFVDRFGSLQEARYREAIAHIDATLARDTPLGRGSN